MEKKMLLWEISENMDIKMEPNYLKPIGQPREL